ncbi:hypothetical protein HDU96_000019 [Phlyctochytrium bullatum]|nr:hypothetical protein HDU96_000019 [Phlyctochytrium bullatum]
MRPYSSKFPPLLASAPLPPDTIAIITTTTITITTTTAIPRPRHAARLLPPFPLLKTQSSLFPHLCRHRAIPQAQKGTCPGCGSALAPMFGGTGGAGASGGRLAVCGTCAGKKMVLSPLMSVVGADGEMVVASKVEDTADMGSKLASPYIGRRDGIALLAEATSAIDAAGGAGVRGNGVVEGGHRVSSGAVAYGGGAGQGTGMAGMAPGVQAAGSYLQPPAQQQQAPVALGVCVVKRWERSEPTLLRDLLPVSKKKRWIERYQAVQQKAEAPAVLGSKSHSLPPTASIPSASVPAPTSTAAPPPPAAGGDVKPVVVNTNSSYPTPPIDTLQQQQQAQQLPPLPPNPSPAPMPAATSALEGPPVQQEQQSPAVDTNSADSALLASLPPQLPNSNNAPPLPNTVAGKLPLAAPVSVASSVTVPRTSVEGGGDEDEDEDAVVVDVEKVDEEVDGGVGGEVRENVNAGAEGHSVHSRADANPTASSASVAQSPSL